MKLPLAFTAVAIAGTLAAQTPATPPSGGTSPYGRTQAGERYGRQRGDFFVQRLTRELSLTPDQQTKVRQIFADTRKSADALRPQMTEQHAALKAAIESNNDAEIDRILHNNCGMIADFHALHAKAMAKVYQLLTPAQKTKFDQMDARWFGPMRGGTAPSGE
ncbi:MAG TPA: Spy/CpxP family protein refolding chaperone [Bryobacteraceae bacterium]|nr:Spy/CpxP family protein refolding chaperone [Bryobacteraceae bacterium]